VIGNVAAQGLRTGPIRLVTAIAIGVRGTERVVASAVTLRASGDSSGWGQLVGPGQRPACSAVIKFAVGPHGDGVATGTSGCGSGEIRSDVIGYIAAQSLCFVPVRLMTAEAIRGIERVVVTDMAGCAGCRRGRHVGANESEAGGAVIEGSRVPTCRGMASGTVGCSEGSTGGGMDRIVGLLPSSEMAARVAAIRGSDGEVVIVVDVAGGARNVCVTLRQEETGSAVVEGRGGPTYRVVAIGAVGGGECGAGSGMRGIVGLLPGGQVAAGIAAVGWGDGEVVIVVDVAGRAGNVGVAIG